MMINKKNVWFVTLCSLILVLTIYYVTMPDSSLEDVSNTDVVETSTVVNESTALVALRVEEDEKVLERMEELQTILLNETASVEEKNVAYEELMTINMNKGLEEKIQENIKQTINYDSFVKINGEQINVVVASKDHNTEIANKIIRLVQNEFETKKYITVKFQ